MSRKIFFDYLKSRHVVVRGGAAPPAPSPAAARGLGRSRGIFSPPADLVHLCGKPLDTLVVV